MSHKKNDAANKVVHELLEHRIVYIQDEQLAAWKANWHGKTIQHSFMDIVKQKLFRNPRVIIIKKSVPTTKICECGFVWNNLTLNDRTLKCPNCGLTEDRDLHAAKMMIRQGQDLKNIKVRKELAELTLVDLPLKGEDETRSCHSLERQ